MTCLQWTIVICIQVIEKESKLVLLMSKNDVCSLQNWCWGPLTCMVEETELSQPAAFAQHRHFKGSLWETSWVIRQLMALSLCQWHVQQATDVNMKNIVKRAVALAAAKSKNASKASELLLFLSVHWLKRLLSLEIRSTNNSGKLQEWCFFFSSSVAKQECWCALCVYTNAPKLPWQITLCSSLGVLLNLTSCGIFFSHGLTIFE